ncbi:MAG: FHA domain-containing protein, partial [Myxococcales bacterium]|nr:FHA domain-containing protein [Myxococcales bacterium]
RDLGSRNGTWLDDRRLEPGESALLVPGTRISFGTEVTFTLEGSRPPAAGAVSEAGRQVEGLDGVLALPGPENPEVVIFWRADRWVMEDEAGERPVGAEVEAGGERWRLHLPTILPATVDQRQPRLEEVDLHLAVSRDEEIVQAEWRVAGSVVRPEPRAYHYLLATLARLRGAEPAEGWVEAEVLARMLAVDRSHLNVQVFRARQEAAALGIEDAAALIERRPGAWMRIGLPDATVGAL